MPLNEPLLWPCETSKSCHRFSSPNCVTNGDDTPQLTFSYTASLLTHDNDICTDVILCIVWLGDFNTIIETHCKKLPVKLWLGND